MMSKRIWYEWTYVKPEEIQKYMGPYDLVGYKEFRTGDNTSIEMPVYLYDKIVNGQALMITKCPNAIRHWAGTVSICFYNVTKRYNNNSKIIRCNS